MRARLAMTFAVMWSVGCGAPSSTDGGVDAGPTFVPTEQRALGLNDVTFLLPLEQLDAGSPFPEAGAMLPLGAFTRLTEAQPVVRTDLARLRVLAVRVDACDRSTVAPCDVAAEGSLRLVLQPVFGSPANVEDVTLHAFFPIPRAEMVEVVDTLRGLSALAALPHGAALQVSTAFTTSPEYRAKLGALVARYASSPRLHRLTLFGQESERAAIVWVFRGEETTPPSTLLGPITIPGIAMQSQEVLLFGGDSYSVTPVADVPSGFARVVMEPMFRNSDSSQQVESVRSLLAVDNPTLNTAATIQCVSCHVATNVVAGRAADAGIDLTTLSERYVSTEFDLTPLGSASRTRTLRALGYFGGNPLVSQRVVNESANVVSELERLYPPP